MKTNITSWGRKVLKGIKKLFLVAFMVSISNQTLSQTSTKLGLTLSRSSSGNGFGSFYDPGVSLQINKNQFDFTANIQHRKMNFRGGQLTYIYNIFEGENDPGNRIGLFVFSSVRYISNAYLSKNWVALEQRVAPESNVSFSSLTFNCIEAYAGFGAKCSISNRLKLHSSIGMGGWGTLSGNKKIYRDYASQSLTLKVGFTYSIHK